MMEEIRRNLALLPKPSIERVRKQIESMNLLRSNPVILKPGEAMMTDPTDTQILDLLADERIFDGYGDVDIDEATLDALVDASIENPTDEQWNLEWRRQFRIAIMRQMARNAQETA